MSNWCRSCPITYWVPTWWTSRKYSRSWWTKSSPKKCTTSTTSRPTTRWRRASGATNMRTRRLIKGRTRPNSKISRQLKWWSWSKDYSSCAMIDFIGKLSLIIICRALIIYGIIIIPILLSILMFNCFLIKSWQFCLFRRSKVVPLSFALLQDIELSRN